MGHGLPARATPAESRPAAVNGVHRGVAIEPDRDLLAADHITPLDRSLWG
jgi:hypothetical protein